MSKAALDQLENHQQQLDVDGIMVGVSRQALEEILEERKELLVVGTKAFDTLEAIYVWNDRVVAGGGTTTIPGIAKAHAMFESLKKNRPRINKFVLQPLKQALSNGG